MSSPDAIKKIIERKDTFLKRFSMKKKVPYSGGEKKKNSKKDIY